MRQLPSMVQMNEFQQELQRSTALGVQGLKIVGDPQAAKVAVISGLTFDEPSAVAIGYVLSMYPTLLADDAAVILVANRDDPTMATGPLNRLPAAKKWDLTVPQFARAKELQSTFRSMKLAFNSDMSEEAAALGGWFVDISGPLDALDKIASITDAVVRVSGLTTMQQRATGTVPLGTIFPEETPSYEIMTIPTANSYGIFAAVNLALSTFAGLDMLRDVTVEKRQRHVYTVSGYVLSDPSQGGILSSTLKPFDELAPNQVLGTWADGTKIVTRGGIAFLPMGGNEIKKGRTDPITYLLRKEETINLTVKVQKGIDSW